MKSKLQRCDRKYKNKERSKRRERERERERETNRKAYMSVKKLGKYTPF